VNAEQRVDRAIGNRQFAIVNFKIKKRQAGSYRLYVIAQTFWRSGFRTADLNGVQFLSKVSQKSYWSIVAECVAAAVASNSFFAF